MARQVIGVVYHWWGDPATNPQFLNIINWLCRANGNSSAHLVGEGGRVAWIVDAINAAWHAGNARGNALYVGYECNPRLSDADYQTMGELHYDMEKAYNKTLEIRVHKEFSQTACSPIDKARIRRIADSLHYQEATPVAPTPQWENMDNPRSMIAARDLYVTNLDSSNNQGDVIKKGTRISFKTKKTVNGSLYLRSEYATSKNINWGILFSNLEEITAPAPDPDPEWIRNLKWDDTIGKLSVLPAGGTRVLHLVTMANVNDEIIPKGTQVDIVGHTTIGGKKYYISSYSKTKGLPWGIPADTLGVPVVVPPQEKPEWLKNLKDVTDQTFYARSDTPILKVEDGSTSRIVPINTPILITHATELLGNEYMVLDGQTELVATVYLSDTPIEKPESDLEKRVGVIEAFISVLVEAFSEFVKTIKAKWSK